MFRKFVALCTLGAAALGLPFASSSVQAQEWPTRPVRFILPFGPASGADIAARLLSEQLKGIWGQPVVVEGRPGGDGLISIRAVVNGKDDHLLFFGPSSAFVVHPYVHDNLDYDPEKDLLPIAGVAKVQVAMAVPTSLGVTNLKEFVALAKSKPDALSYGVAPGFSEFVFNGFLKENDLRMAKVPYRDITQAPPDIGINRIQIAMMSYAAMRAQEQTGNIRVLAINDSKRSAAAPNTPSVVESGFPGLIASPILGLLGPRDMSMAARQKASAGILEALKDQNIVDGLLRSGQPAAPMGIAEFQQGLKEQHELVAKIAKVLNMQRKK